MARRARHKHILIGLVRPQTESIHPETCPFSTGLCDISPEICDSRKCAAIIPTLYWACSTEVCIIPTRFCLILSLERIATTLL